MIYIKMQGRLGNQLFQYAFARNLQKKYYPDEDIKIKFPDYYDDCKNGFEDSLKYFKVKYTTTKKIKINLLQLIILYLYLGFRKIIRDTFKLNHYKMYKLELHFVSILNFLGIYILSLGYYEFKKSCFKNKIIVGSFESDKYFNEIKQEIIREFQPKKEKPKKNKKLYDEIKNCESVCISIRRGDFLSDKYKNSFYVCTPDYFKKAINKMIQLKPQIKFIVFSDDIEWCKNNMNFPKGTCYESGNDPVWEKLRLMSSCKHFIISNSTFSWWAQYLSQNEEKIVIAPSRWKNEKIPNDIYQDDWILIDP